jgi:regulator of RNase E activity RraB
MRTVVGLLVLVEMGCSPDPESSSQLQEERTVISADVLAHQRVKDEAVVRSLANAGADLSKPHSLEHHFVCPNRAAAEPVVAWGLAQGYRPSSVSERKFDGRAYAYFDLVKSTVPTMANISSQTSAMLEIAARHGVEYDGWGCEVVD